MYDKIHYNKKNKNKNKEKKNTYTFKDKAIMHFRMMTTDH